MPPRSRADRTTDDSDRACRTLPREVAVDDSRSTAIDPTRRQVCAAAAFALSSTTAGCTIGGLGSDGADSPAINVDNYHDREWNVTLVVRTRDERELVRETVTVPPDDQTYVDVPIEDATTVHVTVSTSQDSAEEWETLDPGSGKHVSANVEEDGSVTIRTGTV